MPMNILILQGFEHHVKNEHNMWAYVFFLIHLRTTKVNDYTSLEIAVFKQVFLTFFTRQFKLN